MENQQQVHASFGEFVVDEAEARLQKRGHPVELAPRAFQVLCELLRRAGQLVSKDALLDAVWGHRHINEAALKNIVSQLRHALGDDARESVYIETVSRRGYRFIAPVSAAPASASPLPPPDLASDTTGHPIVGRDGVLLRLHQAAAAACSGRRQIVFLVGEAGIGKSTLVERLVQRAELAVAYGHCIEHYGEAEPYMPVLEALNNLCREDEGGGSALALMRSVAPSWLLQLPWFVSDADRRELQRESAGATQDRMLREFGELVDRLSAARPLLLVLEDLHWSDHATVQLLDYLARRRGAGALMVLGTIRPTELIFKDHPLAALRQELRLRRLCQDIELEYLSEAELGDYVAARVGQPAPEEFIRQLHAQTSGLPLFVAAVVDELIAAGALGGAGRWQIADAQQAVPRSIAAVIETQLNRLAPEQQRALGAASVGGLEFTHLALATLLGLDAEALHARLEDAATRLPWLQAHGTASLDDGRLAARYRFTHAIYREVLYERLVALQRLQWHRQWAAVVADTHAATLPEVAAELALHFERGDMPLEAAAQLAIVAARALACGAPSDALQAARHALALAQGRLAPSLELELRVAEAVALTRLEVITAPQVVSAFERALALDAVDSPAWQRALQGAWWVAYSRAEIERARALAAQMQELAARRGGPALRLAGLNASGMVQMLSGEFAAARLSLGEAVDVHDRLSDDEPPPTSFVLDPGVEAAEGLALVCWIAGEPRRARQLAERAVTLAAASRNPLSEVTALYAAAILHALAGEFDVVHRFTERIYGLVDDHALPEKRSGFGWLHGHALVAYEHADEGLAEMRAAAEAAQQLGLRTGLCGFHYHFAMACRLAGREADAAASIEAGLALAAELGETMLVAPMLLMRAEMELARGATEQAGASLRQALITAKAQGATLFELQALAVAQAGGFDGADAQRQRQLLELYRDDPSPIIAAIRAGSTRASA
ncbi:ATP-binding protein [Roseateles violae]|uniref:AAA family ATPase n=1 Tax=Roseateles violae TaxID=3058042 RepID=A0ABT8DZA6_9BURK|nr:AAA family ATPase [Pelomonas sp. PFR6]MDN3922935.1 AAA family ATPase [Pelomonas sp. PFR6]